MYYIFISDIAYKYIIGGLTNGKKIKEILTEEEMRIFKQELFEDEIAAARDNAHVVFDESLDYTIEKYEEMWSDRYPIVNLAIEKNCLTTANSQTTN